MYIAEQLDCYRKPKWGYFKWVFKNCITLHNLDFVHIYYESPRLEFNMSHSHTHLNMKLFFFFFVTRASLEPLFLETSFAKGWQKPSRDRKYLLNKKASLPHCTVYKCISLLSAFCQPLYMFLSVWNNNLLCISQFLLLLECPASSLRYYLVAPGECMAAFTT